jgi:hypothetical protein
MADVDTSCGCDSWHGVCKLSGHRQFRRPNKGFDYETM